MIPEGSEYVGRTIGDVDLYSKDLNVLTLNRGSKIIPNPKGDRILEPGDKLLCFGKMESMRGMVPAKTQRKRRFKIKDLPENVGNNTDENGPTQDD
ncbi:cation:proton antiporter regulatory subunit [Marinobacterium alkalitolerans]|nr:TrkA C-terminal domain-containing protein [Marinobacterium alkalitolerans]